MPLNQVEHTHVHNAKRLAVLGYLLLFLGCFFGVTALIGAIVSHTQLHRTVGTLARSHLILQLVTFWVAAFLVTSSLMVTDHRIWLVAAALFFWSTTLVVGPVMLAKQRGISVSNR